MSFKGYCYKFRLNISHSLQSGQDGEGLHFHTLEIALFMEQNKAGFVPYKDTEKIVHEYMSIYSGKFLNSIAPFDQIVPTIENIGDEFYKELGKLLFKKDFVLVRLEISESPTRIYIAENLQKSSRNEKIAFRIQTLNSAFSDIELAVSKHEKPSEEIAVIKAIDKTDKNMIGIPAESPITVTLEKFNPLKLVLPFLILACCTGVLVWYIHRTGLYPLGFDIYGHLFKADLLYNSLKNGDFYPLYTQSWYNGMQPFRYWAPLPYYILALLEFLTGGEIMTAFLIFIGTAFFVGAAGWVMWGIKNNRIGLCTFLGMLWFFLPDNARVFFSEGNFPRMVIAVIIPYLFYFIWDFIGCQKKRSIFPVMIFMCMITLSHAMLAAMTGIAVFIFGLIYSVTVKRYKESAQLIAGILLSFALCGIWLLPALSGGITSMDSSEIMTSLSSKLSDSLNPFARLEGGIGIYYFGLPLFAVAVLGLFLANKRSFAGFLSSILFLLGTTTALTPILVRLPLSQVLWMRRFTLIAYALFFLSLIEWKEIKKGVLIIFCAVFALDAVPSFNLEQYLSKFIIPVTISTQNENADRYSFTKAKEITSQRISLMDLSAYGPFPSYEFCTGEHKTQYSFGWAWQGAATSGNIVMLNTALENEYFNYMFDRSIEMGDDTVIIRKEQFTDQQDTFEKLQKAAKLTGYELAENGEYSYVYNLKSTGPFGVVSSFDRIAIGTSASEISLLFPSFEKGTSTVLDEYSYESLKNYSEIYLSGFTYKNKNNAEALIKRLTENDVRVVIDMNRIPVNTLTNRSEFLGVTAQPIVFEDRFPELVYNDKVYKSAEFDEKYPTWNTVYLGNLDVSDGYAWFKNEKLNFSGYRGNENTVFMGFNLLYHAMESDDEAVTELMREFLDTDENMLPEREITGLNIRYEKNKITIDSPRDNLNTTIAFQDNFSSDKELTDYNNLLVVNRGVTEIRLRYPYLLQGLAVSLAGLSGTVLFMRIIFKKKRA